MMPSSKELELRTMQIPFGCVCCVPFGVNPSSSEQILFWFVQLYTGCGSRLGASFLLPFYSVVVGTGDGTTESTNLY